jgi:hypothetical protein
MLYTTKDEAHMKKWDHLIESDAVIQRLKLKASRTSDPKDWENYEGALVRDRQLPRRINELASSASLDQRDKLIRLIDKVQGLAGNQVLMVTGMMGTPPERETWLVLALSGNTLRVRRAMTARLGEWRWTSPRPFPKDAVSEQRFYVIGMDKDQLPGDYVI